MTTHGSGNIGPLTEHLGAMSEEKLLEIAGGQEMAKDDWNDEQQQRLYREVNAVAARCNALFELARRDREPENLAAVMSAERRSGPCPGVDQAAYDRGFDAGRKAGIDEVEALRIPPHPDVLNDGAGEAVPPTADDVALKAWDIACDRVQPAGLRLDALHAVMRSMNERPTPFVPRDTKSIREGMAEAAEAAASAGPVRYSLEECARVLAETGSRLVTVANSIEAYLKQE